jgi:hypothetical protein
MLDNSANFPDPQVGHVDEQLFTEVSDLLCSAAHHLPRRFSKAKRTAAAAAAAVRARMGYEVNLNRRDAYIYGSSWQAPAVGQSQGQTAANNYRSGGAS